MCELKVCKDIDEEDKNILFIYFDLLFNVAVLPLSLWPAQRILNIRVRIKNSNANQVTVVLQASFWFSTTPFPSEFVRQFHH